MPSQTGPIVRQIIVWVRQHRVTSAYLLANFGADTAPKTPQLLPNLFFSWQMLTSVRRPAELVGAAPRFRDRLGGRLSERTRASALLARRQQVERTLQDSFSAVSKLNFASKYALVTRCYAKQDEVVLRCMSPRSVCIKFFFHLKMLRISSH